MDARQRRHRIIRFAVGVLVLAAVIGLLVSGVLEGLSPEGVRARLLESGAWGPALFVIAFALLQPFGFAAHVFIIGASLVWPPVLAFVLSWTGAVLAGCVAFAFARGMGRQWVQQRLPERLAAYDERLAQHGLRTVLLMRLTLFTFGPMQLMFGVSRVRFVPFLLGSAIGLVPMIALESWLGGNVLDALLG